MSLFDIDAEIASSLEDKSNEELRSFIRLHEDQTSDKQIELHLYACLLFSIRTLPMKYPEYATSGVKEWFAATRLEHAERCGLLQILNKTATRMSQDRNVFGDTMSSTYKCILDTVLRDHPDQVIWLNSLGNWLSSRFKQTGLIEDLNRAIEVTNMAVDATPQDHPHWAARLNRLGTNLGIRYERTGSVDDLNRAIEVVNKAVDGTLQDHPQWPVSLNILGISLGNRSDRTGSIDDLNHAVEVINIAVDATPDDHPNRVKLLNNLGNWLGNRYEQTGSIDDLNRAIEVTNMAVDATPQDHPHWTTWINNLGNWLGSRYERTGSIDDLNRAVKLTTMAVDATPQDHSDRAMYLGNLGMNLSRRYERTGSMEDLNHAVEFTTMAVDTTPQDHPDLPLWLNSLGIDIGIRYERTGSIDDLDRAVEVAHMAVNAIPQDHPDRAMHLGNLGINLGNRYDRTGSMDDLDLAVEVANMAADATPQDHSDWATRINNLGNWLGSRYERTRSIDDLNRAVKLTTMAVDATSHDHPVQAMHLTSLGNWLGIRYERTGSIDDLNRAVEVTNMAVDASPHDHPIQAMHLNSLGHWLGIQYERTGSIDDLNRAVKVADMAVEATPQGHLDRAMRLGNLGNRLSKLYKRTGSTEDLNRCLSSFIDGWNCCNAPPSIRITLARQAAMILASQSNWQESSPLLQAAIGLLPTVSPRSLKHTDKQDMLREFAGLASTAAAIALNAGEMPSHALHQLESGRGIISGLLMEMRGGITDIEQAPPELVDEFVFLRDLLDKPASSTRTPSFTNDTTSWISQTKQRRDADQKFNELIKRIRAHPGCQNFLLPPTTNELMAAADPDPIIVLTSSTFRCDAFLIEHNQIRVLELPNLTQEEIQKRTKNLPSSRAAASFQILSLLEWLWDTVCGPCLEALGFKKSTLDNNWPHVWWVPTGMLSQLPLHAAGYHTQGSTKAVLDRVMSSYTSSVKALIHGRRKHARQLAETLPEHALLVAMRETPGLSTNQILPFVDSEVEMFHNLCPSLQLHLITPRPRKDDVLKHLAASSIFHFAGHGRSDPVEPSQSCLLLEDWQTNPLTVGDLRDHRLQTTPPFLGYLSACSTGANEADELLDEGIHLVSGLQLAGFRHVVGTLWEVSDRHCVDVARVLYETICKEGMTDLAVCHGLHQAIRALRNGEIEKREAHRTFALALPGTHTSSLMSYYWVPYVHFGV